MGGVRKEAEMKTWEVAREVQAYPGLGQAQDIVNELRGVPGAKCYSTLDSAMRTLRITCTAREQMKALRESRK